MKLLITGAWKHSTNDIAELEKLGYECFFHQNESDPLDEEFYDVEGVVCNGLFLYNSVKSFRNLKFIQLTSAGLDRLPMDYIRSIDIKVFNATGVYSIPIAEFVVASVLDFFKKKNIFYDNQKKHEWLKQRDILELNGKTICIVGCGNIGKECAKLFKAFNCKILGVDLFASNSLLFDSILPIENIASHLQMADVVILTLPLTNETRWLFNLSMLKKMKNTAILVNVSRGGVVETNDLIEAIKNKEIGGAILDVFDEEPLSPSSPLWDLDNVFIYPHNSFIGDGNEHRLSRLIISNLEKQL